MSLPDGVRLTNAEAVSEKHPHYIIPTRAARLAVKARDLVKLSFEYRSSARAAAEIERLWVRVASSGIDAAADTLLGDRDSWGLVFEGVLESVPTLMPSPLDYGSRVAFGPQHIVDIAEPRPSASVSPPRAV